MKKDFFVVALTGGSGTGKSSAAEMFRSLGVKVIDCDKVVRLLQRPGEKCLQELVDAFSDSILNGDGSLNRKALASAGFANEQSLNLLNSVTHKYVLEYLDNAFAQLSNDGVPYCIVEAGALIESGLDKKCDKVILVTADREVQLQRIMRRDNISLLQALQRLSAQKTASLLIEIADYKIKNNGDMDELKEQVIEVKNLLDDYSGIERT